MGWNLYDQKLGLNIQYIWICISDVEREFIIIAVNLLWQTSRSLSIIKKSQNFTGMKSECLNPLKEQSCSNEGHRTVDIVGFRGPLYSFSTLI